MQLDRVAQARAALKRANGVRSRRAKLKRELALGRVSLPAIIFDPPEWMATATIETVLVSSRGIGPVKAARILRRARLSPSRRLGTLARAERNLLVAAIGTRGGATMSLRDETLRKLEEIGGWVRASELAHHLGPDAAYEAFELVELGLLESRTYFSLTPAGQSALASLPERRTDGESRGPAEATRGTAPGPGGAEPQLEGGPA